MPDGRVVIAPTNTTNIMLTLKNGTLHLTGTRKPNVQVDATGTLVVHISGSASAPMLTFTETGLRQAEDSLALLSPFDVGGNPLTVPVKTVAKLTGC